MRLLLIAGDITSIPSSAVVNAANENLYAGGGVDGAIRDSAGPGLTTALQHLYPNGCPTGTAVHTTAFDMHSCINIFHAVGPKVRQRTTPSRFNEAQLCSAYLSVLQQAHSMQLDSVAFPVLSTGIYNYPMDRGLLAGMCTILTFMKEHLTSSIQTVTIVFGSTETMNRMSRYSSSSSFESTSAADIERELQRLRSFAFEKDAPIILKRNNIVIRSFLKKFEDKSDRTNVSRFFMDNTTSDVPIISVINEEKITSKLEDYRNRERLRLKQKRLDDVNYRLSESQKVASKREADSKFYTSLLISNAERNKKRRTNDAPFRLKENTLRNIKQYEISHSERILLNFARRVRRRLSSKKNSEFFSGLLSRDVNRGNRQRIFKKNVTLPSTKTEVNRVQRSVQSVAEQIDAPQEMCRLVCRIAATSLLKFRSATKRQVDQVVRDVKDAVLTGSEVESKMKRLLEKEQHSLRKALACPNSNVTDKALRIGGARLHVKSHEIEGAVGSYYPHQKYYTQKGIAPGFDCVVAASPSTSLESTASSNVNCDGDRHVEYIPQGDKEGRCSDDTSTSLTQPLCELSMSPTSDDIEVDQSQPIFTLHNHENVINPTYAKLCDSSCILPSCDWPSVVEISMTTLLTKDVELLMKSLNNIDYCSMCSTSDLCSSVEGCSNVKRLLLALYSHCQNIRTILRRFYEIKRVCSWLYSWRKALREGNFRQLKRIVNWNAATSTEDSSPCEYAHLHMESTVLEKYTKQLDEFQRRKEDYEIHACFCCTILFAPKQIRRLSTDTVYLAPILSDRSCESEIIICEQCNRSLKKGLVPLLWTGNGLEIPAVPIELQNLNWLETLMIRQVRPIATTYLLNAQTGGRGIKQKGYKGTVLHMPMKIDQTVHRVLKELPSAENFNISVNIPSKQSARKLVDVDMGKVVRALEWLKVNNCHYADVNISLDNPMDELWDKAFSGDPNMDNEVFDIQKPVFDNNLLTIQEEHVSLAYVDAPAPKGLPSDKLFKLKHTKDVPAKSLDKDLDVMTFPELFPTGRFGMQYDRGLHVSDTKFVRRNFRSKDRRFATNPDYCNFINNRQDWKTILGSIYISTKKCASGGDILRSLEDKNPAIDDMTNLVWSQLRSHQHYWAEKKKELRTMIQYLGPPTFFLTVNPAEYDWTELLTLYQAIYPGSTMSVNEFCVHDSAIFVRYFSKRVKAFFELLVLGKNGVLGHAHHYWRRTEYQMRGAPHCHSLIWIKDAPKIGQSPDADVTQFIDQRITCRRPDPISEPLLSKMVTRYQMHRQPCTNTCATHYRIAGKKITKCRFGYPLSTSNTTKLVKDSGVSPIIKSKSYLLKRTETEALINAYNPALLIAWNGNIDVQFVANVVTKVTDYVTAYVGKGESKSTLDDMQIDSLRSSSDMFKWGIEVLRSREMGLPEIMDRNMGQSLHESDLATKFLATNSKDERVRRLLSTPEIVENCPSATATNLVDDYYPKRSVALENFSLFNIATYFNIVSKLPTARNAKCGDVVDPVPSVSNNLLQQDGWNTTDRLSPFFQHSHGISYKVQNMNKWMYSRTGPLLPRLYWPDQNESPESLEDFCRRVLLLFKPWRLETELMGESQSYLDALTEFVSQSSTIAQSQINRILEASRSMYDAILEKRKDFEDQQRLREDMGITSTEAIELQQRVTNEEQVRQGLRSLNEKQLEIYNLVVDTVRKAAGSRDDSQSPLQLFVSGVGGTGKSHLIDVIANKLTLDYEIHGREKEEPPVLIGAPTGFAALAIKGNTLHSLLRLEVENKKMSKYRALQSNSLSDLKMLFRNCRLLIIDEASMVGSTMLLKICLRLVDITGRCEAFGGLNILMFGDLLQLPPVRAREVFLSLRPKDVQRFFHSIPVDQNLWKRSFQYRELIENMRQQDDREFGLLLNRIRIGSPTDDDIKLLQSRHISVLDQRVDVPTGTIPRAATMEETAEYYLKLWDIDPDVLTVFSTLKLVDEFNCLIMSKLSEEIVEIDAKDTMNSRRSSKPDALQRMWQRVGFRRKDLGTDTIGRHVTSWNGKTYADGTKAGLLDVLKVSVGSRVMLRRNLDMSAGLVNGASGVLKRIVFNSDKSVFALIVKFDHRPAEVSIERVTAQYDLSHDQTATRSQFPVVASFAISIHKCQGMSANNVITNLADSFSCGMSYVALSRCRTLDGIHLVDLNPRVIKASTHAIEEYDRLRATIGVESMGTGNQQPSITDLYPKVSRNNVSSVDKRTQITLPADIDITSSVSVPKKRKLDVAQLSRRSPAQAHSQIRFVNTQNDCFVNAAVWCILYSNMAEDVSRGDPAYQICKELDTLLRCDKTIQQSTHLLKRQFPQFDDGRQHDVCEFMDLLLQELPPSLSSRTVLSRQRFRTCSICALETHVLDLTDFIQRPRPLAGLKFSFKDMLSTLFSDHTEPWACVQCNALTVHNIHHRLNTDNCDMMVVQLPMDDGHGQRVEYEFTGRRSPMLFNGHRWDMRCAVGHQGDSMINGHYVAWLKQDDGTWLLMDDQCSNPIIKERFPKFDKSIRCLIFEKICN